MAGLTGDQTRDQAAARDAAETLGDVLLQLVANGLDPAVLALAAVGCGADMLARTLGTETAAAALRQVADDLLEIELKPAPLTN